MNESKLKELLADYHEIICRECDEYTGGCSEGEPCSGHQIKLLMEAQAELEALRDKAWRYDQCSK